MGGGFKKAIKTIGISAISPLAGINEAVKQVSGKNYGQNLIDLLPHRQEKFAREKANQAKMQEEEAQRIRQSSQQRRLTTEQRAKLNALRQASNLRTGNLLTQSRRGTDANSLLGY